MVSVTPVENKDSGNASVLFLGGGRVRSRQMMQFGNSISRYEIVRKPNFAMHCSCHCQTRKKLAGEIHCDQQAGNLRGVRTEFAPELSQVTPNMSLSIDVPCDALR